MLIRSLIFLSLGIVLLVLLTARYKVHPFFALLLSCFFVGLGAGLPANDILVAVKLGFGNILQSIGLLIILGTTLGVVLEYTGSTRVMANTILRKVGRKRAPLAMSLTGFVAGLPIFCDSGFIVLSGLNRSLARQTGIPMVIMSCSLATGLYAVHCLVPPHPGAAAAAGVIGADTGRLILTGILLAIPAAAIGYGWVRYAGRKTGEEEAAAVIGEEQNVGEEQSVGEAERVGDGSGGPGDGTRSRGMEERADPIGAMAGDPSVLRAFLPVLVPILLIAIKSVLLALGQTGVSGSGGWVSVFNLTGEPLIALSIGILLAFAAGRGWSRGQVAGLMQDSAEKAGGILVIIGAGGAFGAVLTATKLGIHISEAVPLGSMGLFFPFLVCFILKTAQGSSTVAIITAASIVQPLLPALGLDSGNGRLLAVLSMGAGSMMISHANDAYFWVIARFSGLPVKAMLRVYTVATILMGLVSLLMVRMLSYLLL